MADVLVVPLTTIDMAALPLVGGKAAQLGVMLGGGLPVPDGFCVTTEAFRHGMDATVSQEIVAAYHALGGGPVAVRSSATAEDLPEASFAGQQDTFLNVSGPEAVVEAVQACWQSLFTERAVAYRRDRSIPDSSVAMAVVVERMVQAEAAGVLFTLNPVTGATDELVIEAARGLGDQVVSARVTPDRYRLRRRAPHELIETEGGNTAALLPPAVLAELARLGLAAERLLGRAADI
jgi:phosphoenolpyruvate synthase/pyruvate phosphate dikinase